MAKKPKSQGKPKPSRPRQAKAKLDLKPALVTAKAASYLPHVVLESYEMGQKLRLVKLIARTRGIPLSEAKRLVDHVPAVAAISPSQHAAIEVVAAITAIGASASVVRDASSAENYCAALRANPIRAKARVDQYRTAGDGLNATAPGEATRDAEVARQHIEGIRDGNSSSTTHTRAAAPTATTAPGAMSGDRRGETPQCVEAQTTSDSVHIGTQEQATTGTSHGSGEPIETGTIQWNSWRQSLACLIEDDALSSLCHRHLEGFNASQWMWNAKGAIWSDPLISLQDRMEQKGFFVKGRTYSHPLLEADAEPGCGTRGCKIGETHVKLAGILEQRKLSPAIQWEVLDTQVYVGCDTYGRHSSNGTVFIKWWFPLRQWTWSNYWKDFRDIWSGGVYEHAEEEFTWRSRVTPVQELSGHLLIFSRIIRFKCTGCEVSWRVGHHVLVPPLA